MEEYLKRYLLKGEGWQKPKDVDEVFGGYNHLISMGPGACFTATKYIILYLSPILKSSLQSSMMLGLRMEQSSQKLIELNLL